MISSLIPLSASGEYICNKNLNLYAQSDGEELTTQAKEGRHLKICSESVTNNRLVVCLCEDNYEGWLNLNDLHYLKPAFNKYKFIPVTRDEIEKSLHQVIEFTYQAMNTPNYYLWGGTIAPNYDCSGLIQSAFASIGVWLPRNSYQQEAFTMRITKEDLKIGDLVFFGKEKVNHVGLYLEDNKYIHSSGKETGNDGIKINYLKENIDPISDYYYKQFWSFGRVMESFNLT